MAVTVTNVVGARYWPEILPSSFIIPTFAAGATTEPLDLRRFTRRIIALRDLGMTNNINISISINADNDLSITQRAIPTLDPALTAQERQWMGFDVKARNTLTLTARNVGGVAINNARFFFNTLINRPTIADKLFHEIDLDPDEREIAQALDLESRVENGEAPISVERVISREFQTIQRYTRTLRIGAVPPEPQSPASFLLEPVNAGEAIVLEGIGGDVAAIADNVRIRVKRDDQINWVEWQPTILDWNVRTYPMWVPAVNELEFSAIASNAVANYDVRLTLRRVKLTKRLKMAWGLMDPADDIELFRQVRGGL